MPVGVWHKVRTAVATKYHDLEQRYGRRMATAIVVAGILGTAVPLPGTSIVAAAPLLGLAELHHQLAAMPNPAAELGAMVSHANAEIRKVAEHWLHELVQLVEPRHDVQ
jgi:hypothetical protein